MRDVFLGVTEIFISKCSEDIQTCFCFGVDVVYVLSERLSSVVSRSLQVWGVVGYVLLMSVTVDFFVETFSLFVWSKVSSMYMYSCRCLVAKPSQDVMRRL